MKLEQQVVSLELAKKLKELGVKQEGLYVWTNQTIPETLWSVGEFEARWGSQGGAYDEFIAFTVAELGEMLPDYTIELGNLKIGKCETDHMTMKKHKKGWWNISYWTWENAYTKNKDIFLRENDKYLQQADTEADARAKMLIYLIENKLITI